MERIASNRAIAAVVARDCTWASVEAMFADSCATVGVTVASNSPPLSPPPSRMSAAVRAENNLAAFAANAADASTLPAAGETTAGNWSAIAATVRGMEMTPAASAGRKSEFAGATTASNSGRVAKSGTNSEAAATIASSWLDVLAATTAERNSAAEETVARKHWAVEAKVESNSQVVVGATDDRNQQAVEVRFVHTENAAAAETAASNSAVFEGRIVSKGSVVAVEKLADNWPPPEERAENN